jgi:hypothetical protein
MAAEYVVRCQVPGARCQVPGARCQVPGAGCQGCDADARAEHPRYVIVSNHHLSRPLSIFNGFDIDLALSAQELDSTLARLASTQVDYMDREMTDFVRVLHKGKKCMEKLLIVRIDVYVHR